MFKFTPSKEWLEKALELEIGFPGVAGGGDMSKKDQFVVEVMGEFPDIDDVLVIDETGNTISLVRTSNWSKEAFGLRIDDSGGFTGVVLTPAQWAKMRDKVDAFLAKRKV